jgi:hypothetical protein
MYVICWHWYARENGSHGHHDFGTAGVEHLLRDVKDATISTLATEVTSGDHMMCCMQQFDVQESSDLCIQYVPKLLHFVSCKKSFMFFRCFFTCWLQKKNKKLCFRSSFLTIEVQLQLKSRALLLYFTYKIAKFMKMCKSQRDSWHQSWKPRKQKKCLVRTQLYIILGWAACVTNYQRNRTWEVHSCGHLSWNCIEMIKRRSESLWVLGRLVGSLSPWRDWRHDWRRFMPI